MGYEVFAALESPDWYMNVVMMSRVPMGVFYSYAHVNTPILGQTNDEGEPASQAFTNNRMWTADLLVNENYFLTLTGLHLKAGRGERNEGWRLGQIALLRDHLEMLMLHDADRNMLVLGDLNTTPGSREFNELLGDRSPVFVDPLAGTEVYSHPSDSVFWRIDHILPNRQMQKELVPESVGVVEPLSREKMIQISDHLPLIARFVIEQ
jgi:endonuclease/exonuclease/phosphatase family metal-dependent hydrolase